MSSTPLLTVSTSPHLMGRTTVRSMHLEMIIALMPAFLTGIYYFGGPGLTVVLLSVVAAVVTEALICKLTKKPNTTRDLHAVLLGLLMGLILPAGAPWWLPLVGGFLTVVLGKMIFGGQGAYPMNPVLVAWVALSLSWPEHMNAFYGPVPPGTDGSWEVSETPLMQLKSDLGTLEAIELGDMWSGLVPGAIGTTCTWALLLGGVYLVWRRIISWRIPLGVILGVLLMSLLATYTDPAFEDLGLEGFAQHWDVGLFQLAAGGLMFAAFFLAPEPVTSPMTPWGTILFGLGVGFMTVIVRCWGSHTDGVFYGVLLMNAATPLFDRIRPKVLGKVMSGD